jgi:2-methylcitrate dehydratase PrpD
MTAILCSGDLMATEPATQQLAQFLVESRWRDIPGEVRHEAKRSVMNFVGTALGGCRDEAMAIALEALARSSARRRRR